MVNVVVRNPCVIFLVGRDKVMYNVYLRVRLLCVVGVPRGNVRVEGSVLVTFVYCLVRSFFGGLRYLIYFLFLVVNRSRVVVRFRCVQDVFWD